MRYDESQFCRLRCASFRKAGDQNVNVPALTTDQMITVDRLMIQEFAVSLEQMMENAGHNLADLARRMLGGALQQRSLAVLCGLGNNGGGGMVAARHLHNWGARVAVVLAGEASRLKDTPRHQWEILARMGLAQATPKLAEADLVIDALIGYGMHGEPRPPVARWIERMNAAQAPILSLDVPSGLDATTGAAGTSCVRATATLALALPKTGLLAPGAQDYVGELWLADIGVPPELYRRMGLGVVLAFAEASIVRLAERPQTAQGA